MLILAVESATIGVGAAVVDERGVVASRSLLPGRLQTETLHPLIAQVMELAGTEMRALDAIAVDIGPGLFTGLRVGVATAKALAYALGIPVVACTSTAALLAGASGAGAPAVAIIDVRRSEVVYALGSEPDRCHLVSPVEAAAALERADGLNGAVLVGDGHLRYRDQFAAVVARRSMVVGEQAPRFADPAVIGRIAVDALATGGGVDAIALEPLYLREADARINWHTRDLSKVSGR